MLTFARPGPFISRIITIKIRVIPPPGREKRKNNNKQTLFFFLKWMRQRSKSIEKSNKDKDNERAILKRENIRLDGNFLCERIRMIRLKRLGSRKRNQLACDKQGRTNEQILLFSPKKLTFSEKASVGWGSEQPT